MPLIEKQKYGGELLVKFLNSSDYTKQSILTQAAKLQAKPVIKEFHWPTRATKTKNKLRHYEGHATATETILERTGFRKREVKMDMSLIKDIEGRFEFILQSDEDSGYIVTCKVAEKLRGEGLFSTMVGAISTYCFNHLGLRFVGGSARSPRTEPQSDWRCVREPYRANFETGKMIKLTKLHKLWLSQKYAVHGKVVGSDEPEGFALLNPDYLLELPKEEFISLDEHHPKSEENTFLHLMEQKGAVA